MTAEQEVIIKQQIEQQYPEKKNELIVPLERYIVTNAAKGSNRMSFVELPYEVRMLIVKQRGTGETHKLGKNKVKLK